MYYVYNVVSVLLILFSLAIIVMDFQTANGAPQQAVVMAEAIFFAVLARIAQASAHQWNNKK